MLTDKQTDRPTNTQQTLLKTIPSSLCACQLFLIIISDCIFFVLGALQKMQMFEETVEEDFHRLTDLEDVSRWQPIQQIPTKHLQREADQTKVLNKRRKQK